MSTRVSRWPSTVGLATTAASLLVACAGTDPAIKPSGDAERSKAAFIEMADVLTHPRCVNCHPNGDSPTRGDTMVAHDPPVVGGNIGMGVPGMRCSTCHGEANVALAEGAGSVPGAPTWQLAPASMAFAGKSPRELCEQLKGGPDAGSLEDIIERHSNDPLTGWAWTPGEGRTPAPGTHEEFARQTRAWIDNGAHCPDG